MGGKPRTPPARVETARQALQRCLDAGGAYTVRELSQEAGISERQVAEELPHLERSLKREGRALSVEPPRCRQCGFRFEERTRVSRPSRCPSCRSERLDPARISLG
jgi:transcriptional regulator